MPGTPELVKYLEEHLRQVAEATEDGCQVMGYLWWGPMNIVSAGTGDLHRSPKRSYERYRETNQRPVEGAHHK